MKEDNNIADSNQKSSISYTFKPIGTIYTPFQNKVGVPIQGIFDSSSRGRVEVFEQFEEGLKDIEGFSHLILLYVFHKSKDYKLLCKPYMEDKIHGVFAMRAPKRPNPIGLSVVRLIRREGRILHIAEIDILNETPLLDIKPLIPRIDYRENVKIGWLEKRFKSGAYRKFSDDRF